MNLSKPPPLKLDNKSASRNFPHEEARWWAELWRTESYGHCGLIAGVALSRRHSFLAESQESRGLKVLSFGQVVFHNRATPGA